MNRRLLLAVGVLTLLAGMAGCSTLFGPGSVDKEDLAGEEGRSYDYTWNTSRDAHLTVDGDSYAAVYAVANRTTGDREGNYSMELYTKDALGTEQPMQVRALQFRYENGTVLRYERYDGDVRLIREYPNGTTEPAEGLAVDRTRKHTVVYIPTNESGKLAFTTPKNGKRIATPTFVRGSYEMILPEHARVGVPLLAQVQPSHDSAKVVDGRVHIVWTGVDRAPSVVVRYYLERDLYIFGALVVGLVLVGAVGAVYYWLQIRETVRRREEVGLDVETGDDEGRDPPPGMG